MKIQDVRAWINEAHSKSTEEPVRVLLEVALNELDDHLAREKARVKKYRDKDYIKLETCTKDCTKCTLYYECICPDKRTREIKVPSVIAAAEVRTAAEAVEKPIKVKKERPADSIDEALALLDEPIMPTVVYDGLMDDLEEAASKSETTEEDGLLDDIESILGIL